ncbi:MAG TPA: hypothetical protein ENJ39_01700 [Flammeovirgaceae bacterium]|nr:hypothetical protein [Flammeovirgaceae bacterium]
MYKKAGILLFLWLALTDLHAQPHAYRIDFVPETTGMPALTGRADSAGFMLRVQEAYHDLLWRGYLLANIDSLQMQGETWRAQIHVGQRYRWQALGVRGIPEELLSKAGYRQHNFDGRLFSVKEFSRLVENLLSLAAENGHPFATLKLDAIAVDSNRVSATLVYHAGPEIRYDSLALVPPNLVKPAFLAAYLHILPGELYQLKTIRQLPLNLSRLPYLNPADTFTLSYRDGRCRITLPLQAVKANKIDGLIGFLPSQKVDNKLLVTGYVNLELHNLFRAGKYLRLAWQQFNRQSQTLNLAYRHPNLFASPVGLSGDFNLLRQDTAFLQTAFHLQAFYRQRYWEVWFKGAFRSSRPLAVPADSLSLPAIADYKLRQAGAGLAYSTLTDAINPIGGGRAFAEGLVGSKQINKSPGVAESVYDSLALRPLQTAWQAGGEYNLRLGRLLVGHADATVAAIFSNERLFVNDLLRLGGVSSLRGFNDLELYVSEYALLRLELRLLMGSDSRLFLFYDQAFTRNRVYEQSDTPLGFGGGLVLNTGAGMLQLVYALGVSDQQSLSLAQSRIHVGYVARF